MEHSQFVITLGILHAGGTILSHTITRRMTLLLCITVNNSLLEFSEFLYLLLWYSHVYMGIAGVLVTNDKIQAYALVVAVYCLSVQNFELERAAARLCQKKMVRHRHGRNALQLAKEQTP